MLDRLFVKTFAAVQALDSNTTGAPFTVESLGRTTVRGCLLGSIEFVVSRNGRPDIDWQQSISQGPKPSQSEIYLCGHPHWCYHGHHQCRDDDQHPSFRGLCRLGSESGLGHAYRSRVRDDRLCEESSHLCHDEVEMLIGDEESDHDDCLDHGHHPVRHGRSQTARMRKEAYGPTGQPISITQIRWPIGKLRTSIFKTSSRPRRLLCIS